MRAPHTGLLVAASLLTGTARADKFTHTVDVKPPVTLTEKAKPIQKKETPPVPLTGAQLLDIAALQGAIHQEQIQILKTDLIPNTPDSQVEEKADYIFRLGEIYAKLNRLHRLKAAEAEIALAKAAPKDRPALQKQIAEHQKAAKQALLDTVTTLKGMVENPKYVGAPKIDVAVFYLAYTLQGGGYLKEARDAYDRLLKNYPNSKYIPDAHFAFGESYFESKQLADAEASYKKVLRFPQSSVYRHAQYKLGWVAYNLGKFPDAMQAFNDVVQGTRGDADKAVLHRAAKMDFVRAYAEVGKADKALAAFKRVSGGDGLDMLETLADLYMDQGKGDKAIYTYRELMTARPSSPKVCVWEHTVSRAMLTVGSLDDRATEIERLVKLYTALSTGKTLPKAELAECRDAAAEMSGMYARTYHQEGAKTKNPELLRIASRLYRAYLAGFPTAPDFADTQYFHAEVSWLFAEMETNQRLAVQKWSDAAAAFTAVLDSGKLSPKLIQVSADAAMLARMKELHIDPRVKHQDVSDAAYDTVATPKPIPPDDAKLLAAYDGYLKYVKDPKDDERIDVMFHRANLLRRYDHFAEAIPALEDIALHHATHETAPWAAQLALDSYNRLKNYDGMFAFVEKLPEKTVAGWPEVEATVKTLRRQGIRKQAEGYEAEARKSGKLELFVKCANKYLEAYNKDPLADDADVILYNSGVCFESGKSLSASLEVYKLLLELFPKSPQAAKSLARIGNVHATVAHFKEAADYLEQYSGKYAGMADAFKLLSDAVQFRKGIGDDAKAIADTELFIRMFGAKQSAEAATAFYSMTSIYEKQGNPDKLAAHLRAYLAKYGAIGGADRRVIANAKLGQTLWQASCPVPTVDGTCMKMTRVASTARKLRVQADGVPKRCGDETQAELVMIPRDAGKVKAAMTAFAAATSEYEKAGKFGDKEDARGALYHYGLARFGKLERDYEQYLTMQIPTGLAFSKKNPALADKSLKRFEAWFQGKAQLGVTLRKQYEAIIDLKDGATGIASAARLGSLTQNFSVQLYRAEIPADQRTGPYAEDTAQEYCETLEKLATPLEADSTRSYEACLNTSTRLGWFSEWSRACERELGQMLPDRYPKAFELRRQPDVAASIVDLAPPEQL